MLQKSILVVKLISYGFSAAWEIIRDSIAVRIRSRQHASLPPFDMNSERPNIVIVGASFAGYHAAYLIAGKLPPRSNHRVVVVEPHSHFHFTWVLPRFCVVGQEHKAFIPYGPYLSKVHAGRVKWIQDRVLEVGEKSIRLQGSGEIIPYEFLVIATGSGATVGLPSRVGADQREDGTENLRDMQRSIKDSQKLVIVGAGAAGFELATDAKYKYPDKQITLVHSRDAVMNRFGPELRAAAAKTLKDLGVEVILSQRMESTSILDHHVMLKSGQKLECDFMVNCTGPAPASSIIERISPTVISETGHIYAKPTLQVLDDSLPNVYVCGDVLAAGIKNPNARAAMRQAMVVAGNIISAVTGNSPTEEYTHLWADGATKLTLGLDKSVLHVEDGKTELLLYGKENDLALASAGAWKGLGVKPFEDSSLKV